MNSAGLRVAAGALLLVVGAAILWLQFRMVLSLEPQWQRWLVLGLFLILSFGLISSVLGDDGWKDIRARLRDREGGRTRRLANAAASESHRVALVVTEESRVVGRAYTKIGRVMVNNALAVDATAGSRFQDPRLAIREKVRVAFRAAETMVIRGAEFVRTDKVESFLWAYVAVAFLTLAFQLQVRSGPCAAAGDCAASYAKGGCVVCDMACILGGVSKRCPLMPHETAP